MASSGHSDVERPQQQQQQQHGYKQSETLSSKMDRMRDDGRAVVQSARHVLSESEAASLDERREAVFRDGVASILRAMRPEFGPANAWLFGERSKVLRKLAEAVGFVNDEDVHRAEGVVRELQDALELE